MQLFFCLFFLIPHFVLAMDVSPSSTPEGWVNVHSASPTLPKLRTSKSPDIVRSITITTLKVPTPPDIRVQIPEIISFTLQQPKPVRPLSPLDDESESTSRSPSPTLCTDQRNFDPNLARPAYSPVEHHLQETAHNDNQNNVGETKSLTAMLMECFGKYCRISLLQKNKENK